MLGQPLAETLEKLNRDKNDPSLKLIALSQTYELLDELSNDFHTDKIDEIIHPNTLITKTDDSYYLFIMDHLFPSSNGIEPSEDKKEHRALRRKILAAGYMRSIESWEKYNGRVDRAFQASHVVSLLFTHCVTPDIASNRDLDNMSEKLFIDNVWKYHFVPDDSMNQIVKIAHEVLIIEDDEEPHTECVLQYFKPGEYVR